MQKSKDAHRRRLAAAPIGEKLRMLDVMRERALAVRNAVIRESAAKFAPPDAEMLPRVAESPSAEI